MHYAFTSLACSLICFNKLQDPFGARSQNAAGGRHRQAQVSGFDGDYPKELHRQCDWMCCVAEVGVDDKIRSLKSGDGWLIQFRNTIQGVDGSGSRPAGVNGLQCGSVISSIL